MEEKIAALNLSQKEIDSARKTYRKAKQHRPFGFVLWLIFALIWAGFGYLTYSVGEVDGGGDMTGVVIGVFGIPTALMVLFCILGNSKSKKKHQMWNAEVAKMNPVLTELFKQELIEEKEKQRLEDIEWKKKNEEQFREDMKEVGQDMKKLGKLIVENIKADIEDAWWRWSVKRLPSKKKGDSLCLFLLWKLLWVWLWALPLHGFLLRHIPL